METETGWWLVTHPEHARLAGAFAAAWGNERFRKPEPRARVLHGIAAHDDGWTERDAQPSITRQGKPAAFSTELVGKYSAFEEIDLADYLAVRDRAVRLVAEQDAYAGLLIALHTHNLLTARADRSTIAADQLPLLDRFLQDQREYHSLLVARIEQDCNLSSVDKAPETVHEHFRLLQACDNLSLLSCVAFDSPADMLHALPLNEGGAAWIQVKPVGVREYRLDPWPFQKSEHRFQFAARHVLGHIFDTSAALQSAFVDAEPTMLEVRLLA